jgi:hypothetical protein
MWRKKNTKGGVCFVKAETPLVGQQIPLVSPFTYGGYIALEAPLPHPAIPTYSK